MRYTELMFAFVSAEPVFNGQLVESCRVYGFSLFLQPFKIRDELGNQCECIGSSGKLLEVVYLFKQSDDFLNLFFVAANIFFEVLPYLAVIKRKQGA